MPQFFLIDDCSRAAKLGSVPPDRVRNVRHDQPIGHSVRAVSFYRSKFSDCPAGAVANSHPNVDLL